MSRSIWLRASDSDKPGVRLRLEKQEQESGCHLVEEEVLPEEVNNPDNNHTCATMDSLFLTRDDQEWLHAALGELLGNKPLAMVGISEIAEMAGVGRAAVCNWRAWHKSFPRPYADLRSGPVFRRQDIESWLLERPTIPRPLRARIRK